MATAKILLSSSFSVLLGSGCSHEPLVAKPTSTADIVRIPGGTCVLGSGDPQFPDAAPAHRVTPRAFCLGAHELSKQFGFWGNVSSGHD